MAASLGARCNTSRESSSGERAPLSRLDLSRAAGEVFCRLHRLAPEFARHDRIANWAEGNPPDSASFWMHGPRAADHEETIMDKDRVEGVGHQVKGAVKETAGKMMGDKKTEAEGKAERAAGKVQNAVGGAKDAVRDATKEWSDR
jgi:uncharacterized protein YjbJ (UPF0337 family)